MSIGSRESRSSTEGGGGRLASLADRLLGWRQRQGAAEPLALDPEPLEAAAEHRPDAGSAGASDALDILPRVRFTEDGRFDGCNARFREVFLGDGAAEPTGREAPLARIRLAVARYRPAIEDDADSAACGRLADPAGRDHALTLLRREDGLEVLATPVGDDAASTAASGLGDYVEAGPVGVVGLDSSGTVVALNAAGRELLSGVGGEPVGARFVDLLPVDRRTAMTSAIRAANAGSLPEDAVEIELGDTHRAFLSAEARKLPAGGGAGRATVAVYLTDVSHAKQLEQQSVQAQRMQAVGQLAGGVAHDFNNLLTAMTGYCDLLLMRHRPGDQSFADIMQIKQNVNRASNLVRQLLAFSRQQTLVPKVLDVTETLADLSNLLRRLIGEGVRLSITHGRDLRPVKVDLGQFEQLIVNLVVNARDAMTEGGTVAMRTYNVDVDQDQRQGEQSMPSGDYVLIEVADSGTGIEPEHLDRIFEPFFSTKPVGAGAGLGLATVYGIVKQAGGSVFVDSVVGSGTTFSIYIPAYDGEETPTRVGEGEVEGMSEDLTGEGTILLVEDEDPVRLFAARALRSKGYRVLEARSGEAALAQIADGSDPIDLVITDVVMPGMDGPTLVRHLREQLGDLRVICISGYAEEDVRRRIDEDTAIRFLPKPFSLSQLAALVKTAMRSAP